MLKWIFRAFRQGRRPSSRISLSHRPVLERLEDRTLPAATTFVQTNLVSDVANAAQLTDPNLHNPWGVLVAPSGDFWVNNANSGSISLYKGGVNGAPIVNDQNTPVILTPVDANGGQIMPTAIVYNSTSSFVVINTNFNGPAPYFIAGKDGTITAVTPTSTVPADTSYLTERMAELSNTEFTGLAIGGNASGNYIYAAAFDYTAQNAGKIDIFNTNFQQVTLSGNFVDPHLPAGYSPFNIVNINNTLYVTYDNVDNSTVGGLVDTFDTNGNFLSRFASGSNLNAPWAVVQAPASFGTYANDILIGNFGDGHISAYSSSGTYVGQLTTQNGQTITNPQLWGLTFGNGTAGDAGTLYFSAGLNNEQDGLFGSIQPTTGSGSTNPTNPTNSTNQAFVAQLYTDLLQRPADAGGLAYWTSVLNKGVAPQQVVTDIENTAEYRNLEVNALYVQLLHRQADPAGLNYWSAELASGTTYEQVASNMAGSQEFFTAQGGGTVSGFLTVLYQDALNRAPDAGGLAFYTQKMQAGATSAQVAASFFGSTEFETDRITSFYESYLNRAADAGGLAYFLASLKSGGTDLTVIAAIIGSPEFFSDL